MAERFRNRTEAGRLLAKKLTRYANQPDVLVLALPRGGVPVAFEVARALHAPLDVFLVRKLGVPGHEELAMGAIASGGVRTLNQNVVRHLRIPAEMIDEVTAREWDELRRREREYHGDRPAPDVRGRTIILIDDGLATGSTMRSAVEALRRQDPRRIVIAVPVASPSTCEEFRDEVDEVVCARTPDPFYAVGIWYEDFSQTTDEEVRDLLIRRGNEIRSETQRSQSGLASDDAGIKETDSPGPGAPVSRSDPAPTGRSKPARGNVPGPPNHDQIKP